MHDISSWGGLFTLGVLLNHPESFRNFVASSPSIWWNWRSVLANVPAYLHRVRAKVAAPRVLILVGSQEQAAPAKLPAGLAEVLAKQMRMLPAALRNLVGRVVVKKMMLDWRKVDNARGLAARLKRTKGRPGYQVDFHAFEGEDHLTALSASIG